MIRIFSRLSTFWFPGILFCAVGAVWYLQWYKPFAALCFGRNTKIQTIEFSDSITVRFVLYNRSSKEVQITAIEKNCDCATIGPLPCIAQPFSEVEVPIRLNASSLKLPATRQFYFHTNPPQPGLVGEVTIVPAVAQN